MGAELERGDPESVGPYRLLRRLSSGGMGRVFLAESPAGPIAVKVIHPDLSGDPEFRRRFASEIAAARNVSGKFTLALVDADPDAAEPWMATAYVPGPSLDEVVGRYGPLPLGPLLTLAIGLAEGLRETHAAGLVHRDLKPSNVILADDGPRLIDFGVAKAADDALDDQRYIVGTPGYMSPEVLSGQPVGQATDVFSLGAVLTTAATGDGPFGHRSQESVMYRTMSGEPALSGVPRLIRSLVAWCLAKAPADRPSVSEVLAYADGLAMGLFGLDRAAFMDSNARLAARHGWVAEGDDGIGSSVIREPTGIGKYPLTTARRRDEPAASSLGSSPGIAPAEAASPPSVWESLPGGTGWVSRRDGTGWVPLPPGSGGSDEFPGGDDDAAAGTDSGAPDPDSEPTPNYAPPPGYPPAPGYAPAPGYLPAPGYVAKPAGAPGYSPEPAGAPGYAPLASPGYQPPPGHGEQIRSAPTVVNERLGAGAAGESSFRSADGSGDGEAPEDPDWAGEPRPRYLTGILPERAPSAARISLIVLVTLASSESPSSALKPFVVPPAGCAVTVTVSAPGLIPSGDLEQELFVPFAEDSEPIRFGFTAGRAGLHSVVVRAFSGGTFLGELALQISVEVGAALEEGRGRAVVLAGLAAEPGEVTLQVSRTDEDRYSFQLIGETLYRLEITKRLAGDPSQVVGALVEELRAISAQETRFSSSALIRNRIRNLGAQLWSDVVPEAIRRQFWAQRDRIKLFSIASDMDTVPWELLYPVDGDNDRGFLVEDFPVVRRVYGQDRVRQLPLSSAAYIVPPGSPANAMDEVRGVRGLLPPTVSDRGVFASLGGLIELLDASPSVLHFACHNSFTEKSGSVISLEGGPMRPSDLAVAVQKSGLAAARPLVFLNACRTAGEIEGLMQMMGWAKQFMGAGAGAFIGSLWAVRSSSARTFAEEFYRALVNDQVPLGAASLRARQAISGDPGDPTWLAYTVYGNPSASIASSSPAQAAGLR
ncbi:MAG: CHAT domain-containing protein [Trebonia sp.]